MELGEADGVLVFDPSAFPNQGTESVGVQRQWCGRLGKLDNCQVGIYLAYVSRRAHALVDLRLYLPKKWTRRRLKKAGVPAEVRYRTRHELALQMLDERGARFGAEPVNRGVNTFGHPSLTGQDAKGPRRQRRVLRRLENGVVRMIAGLAQRIARHALVLRALANEGKIILGAHLRFFLDALLGDGIECAFIGDEQVVIRNDVDAGDARPVLHYLRTENLELVAILNTHHHPDHTGNNGKFVATGAQVVGLERMKALMVSDARTKEIAGPPTTTFERDAATHRVTATVDPLGRRTEYTYDAADQLLTAVKESTPTPPVVLQRLAYTYDPAGNLEQITNRGAGGELVSQLTYTFDKSNHKRTQVENDGTVTTWTYDQVYQLPSSPPAGPSRRKPRRARRLRSTSRRRCASPTSVTSTSRST